MNAGTSRRSSPVNTPEALDGELRATLGEAPVPRLSAGFAARLAARIAAAEAVPERHGRRRRPGALLPVYWLFAAGAARWILAEIEWATVPRLGIWYLTAAAIFLLLPSLVLAWQAKAALR